MRLPNRDLAIYLFYGIYFILFCMHTTINDKKGEEKKKDQAEGRILEFDFGKCDKSLNSLEYHLQ